jgi:hypothetical protein
MGAEGRESRGQKYDDEDLRGERAVYIIQYNICTIQNECLCILLWSKHSITYITGHVFRDQDEMLKFLMCPYMNRSISCYRLLKLE